MKKFLFSILIFFIYNNYPINMVENLFVQKQINYFDNLQFFNNPFHASYYGYATAKDIFKSSTLDIQNQSEVLSQAYQNAFKSSFSVSEQIVTSIIGLNPLINQMYQSNSDNILELVESRLSLLRSSVPKEYKTAYYTFLSEVTPLVFNSQGTLSNISQEIGIDKAFNKFLYSVLSAHEIDNVKKISPRLEKILSVQYEPNKQLVTFFDSYTLKAFNNHSNYMLREFIDSLKNEGFSSSFKNQQGSDIKQRIYNKVYKQAFDKDGILNILHNDPLYLYAKQNDVSYSQSQEFVDDLLIRFEAKEALYKHYKVQTASHEIDHLMYRLLDADNVTRFNLLTTIASGDDQEIYKAVFMDSLNDNDFDQIHENKIQTSSMNLKTAFSNIEEIIDEIKNDISSQNIPLYQESMSIPHTLTPQQLKQINLPFSDILSGEGKSLAEKVGFSFDKLVFRYSSIQQQLLQGTIVDLLNDAGNIFYSTRNPHVMDLSKTAAKYADIANEFNYQNSVFAGFDVIMFGRMITDGIRYTARLAQGIIAGVGAGIDKINEEIKELVDFINEKEPLEYVLTHSYAEVSEKVNQVLAPKIESLKKLGKAIDQEIDKLSEDPVYREMRYNQVSQYAKKSLKEFYEFVTKEDPYNLGFKIGQGTAKVADFIMWGIVTDGLYEEFKATFRLYKETEIGTKIVEGIESSPSFIKSPLKEMVKHNPELTEALHNSKFKPALKTEKVIEEKAEVLFRGELKAEKNAAAKELEKISKTVKATRPISDYSGKLIQSNKPDAVADLLAKRIQGESRVRFANDIYGQEFDAISKKYIAETKPALKTIDQQFRNQAKNIFEAARQNGKEVYFHFEGEPCRDVIRKLKVYEKRYNIKLELDYIPLK